MTLKDPKGNLVELKPLANCHDARVAMYLHSLLQTTHYLEPKKKGQPGSRTKRGNHGVVAYTFRREGRRLEKTCGECPIKVQQCAKLVNDLGMVKVGVIGILLMVTLKGGAKEFWGFYGTLNDFQKTAQSAA